MAKKESAELTVLCLREKMNWTEKRYCFARLFSPSLSLPMKPWRDENGIQYVGVGQFMLDEDFLSH